MSSFLCKGKDVAASVVQTDVHVHMAHALRIIKFTNYMHVYIIVIPLTFNYIIMINCFYTSEKWI